jgi:hypothetical protein
MDRSLALLALLPLCGCHLFSAVSLDKTCEDLPEGCDGEGGEGPDPTDDTGEPDPVDADGDGYTVQSGDCDDANAVINPAGQERCDELGVDEDCDGLVNDEDNNPSDQALFFLDADEDGFGDPAVSTQACEAPAGFVEQAGDCFDGSSAAAPGLTEVCGDRLDNDCDGSPNECGRWEGNRLLTSREGFLDGEGEGISSGISVGDATGDGRLDVVAGTFAGGTYNTGGAMVFTRLDRAPEQTASDRVAAVEASSEGYGGGSVWLRSDVTGDGYADIIQQGTKGYYYLAEGPFYGSQALEASHAIFTGLGAPYYYMPNADTLDLSGDGEPDVVITTPYTDSGAKGLFLFRGPIGGGERDATAADATITDPASSASNFGSTALLNGDYNGDGVYDVVIGDPDNTGYRSTETGTVWLFDGPVRGDSFVSDADAVIAVGQADSYGLGVSMAAGDTTGDGVEDLAIGVFAYGSAWVEGGAFVMAGPISGSLLAKNTAIAGFIGNSSYTGYAVAMNGDFDMDGFADLAVAAPLNSARATDAGAVHLQYGPLSGVTDAVDCSLTIYADKEYAYAGRGLTFSRDLNGDSMDDLLVGSFDYYGDINIFWGRGI